MRFLNIHFQICCYRCVHCHTIPTQFIEFTYNTHLCSNFNMRLSPCRFHEPIICRMWFSWSLPSWSCSLSVITCTTISEERDSFCRGFCRIPGCCRIGNISPLNKCSDYVIDLTHDARRHPLGPFNPQFDLVGNLRRGLELHLPSNSHRVCSGRLFVSVTSLKDRKNVIISEFDSKEELIQV